MTGYYPLHRLLFCSGKTFVVNRQRSSWSGLRSTSRWNAGSIGVRFCGKLLWNKFSV